MDVLSISIGEIARETTLSIRVTGQRRFAARLWIAQRFLAFAAFVIGSKLSVEADLS